VTANRQQAISELEKLWSAIFGGPPAVRCEAETLAQFIVDHLPSAPAYRPGLVARTFESGGEPEPKLELELEPDGADADSDAEAVRAA
jgi:hypothetical protein